MSEIQRFPPMVDANPVHPNAKSTTQINNGTTCTKSNILTPVCRNCKTQTTPLWRRDETGQVLCNACGLFLKLHGRPRPISLKTDTIKLRNRIKQPNFSKLGPNTPELKLKDVKLGRKLPKSAKKKGGSPLPDVAPQNTRSPLPAPTRAPFAPGHPFAAYPLQVQLLHYPLLTPAQFAPGLQRITSPLLLLTTALMLNARALPKGLLAAQAAGALENMLNELGPSATFKSGAPVNGGLLMGGLLMGAKGGALLTPASALAAPKLPTLGPKPDAAKVIASPSFGPQFHLLDPAADHSVKHESPDLARPALPPLQHVQPAQAALPHFQASFSSAALTPLAHSRAPSAPLAMSSADSAPAASPANLAAYTAALGAAAGGANNAPLHTPLLAPLQAPLHPTPHSTLQANTPQKSNQSNGAGAGGAGAGGAGGNGPSGNGYEVNLLKTRISELELVNDLYRTRIMELEAMEQAARLRETSMRKRLDEILAIQGQVAPTYGDEPDAKRFKANS